MFTINKKTVAREALICLAVFLTVVGVVSAATTIGSNIATGGNITVAPAFGLDASAAGVLNIGTTTATTINIGGTQALTKILGNASTTMVSLSGSLWIGGFATTTSAGAISTQSTLAVTATSSLATTTINRLLSVGSTTPQHNTAEVLIDGTATTTLRISSSGSNAGGCIQMEGTDGINYRMTVTADLNNATSTLPTAGYVAVWVPGVCK